MPHRKTIRLYSHGPLAVNQPSYWEDVWLQYKLNNKKVVKEGPCIVSAYDLRSEIRLQEKLKEEHPSEWRDDMVDNLHNVQKQFDDGARFALESDECLKDGLANIYVNEEEINRKNAEEAIAWYLRKKGVLKSTPRFRWEKARDRIIVQPVTLMGD